MKKLLITFGLILLLGITAWAQSENTLGTGQWLHDCWIEYQKSIVNDPGTNWRHEGQYDGFVLGVWQLLIAADRGSLGVEIPASATWGQVNAVVGKYLDAHPEEWNDPAIRLVLEAFVAAWPYKK